VVDDYKTKLQSRTDHHMGYPYNLDFDYGPLEGLQKFMINNLGDPFIESNYGVHSREFEASQCFFCFFFFCTLFFSSNWGAINDLHCIAFFPLPLN
jgi:hypothetical protein